MIFGRKRKGTTASNSGSLTGKLKLFADRQQQRLALRLNRWAARYGTTEQRWALLLFCLLFGGYCLYILASSIF